MIDYFLLWAILGAILALVILLFVLNTRAIERECEESERQQVRHNVISVGRCQWPDKRGEGESTMSFQELSENDRAEIEKFKLYLKDCARWDEANGMVGEFNAMELVRWRQQQLRAHASIYQQIYEEGP